MHETTPRDVLVLALKVMDAIQDSPVSPYEKAAALKVAAEACTQAAVSQQAAVSMAEMFRRIGKGGQA